KDQGHRLVEQLPQGAPNAAKPGHRLLGGSAGRQGHSEILTQNAPSDGRRVERDTRPAGLWTDWRQGRQRLLYPAEREPRMSEEVRRVGLATRRSPKKPASRIGARD